MSDNASNGNGTPERGDGPAAGAEPEMKGSDVAGAGEAPVVEDTAARIARLEEEKQENWNRFLRATADLENFRKRTRRELDDARSEARTRVLKEMLPVIDNLERAVEHAQKSSGDGTAAGIIEGVQLVLRQFGQALERCEVVPVDAQGKPFDPNLHEAISQIESAAHPPGSVVQVLQRGYKIGDRLLRPSLVVVAKAPPGAQAPEADAGEPPEGTPEA